MKYDLIAFVSIGFVVLFGAACHSQDKKILDRWETKAPAFALRITEFQESRFAVSKFRYVFEGKPNGSDEWREIISVIADDDTPIPREQVRFLGNQAAYVFMTDQFAITTDGGHSWSVWKANDRIGTVQYPRQFIIKEVLVNPDGTGKLTVVSRSADRQTMKFQTENFGQSWVAN